MANGSVTFEGGIAWLGLFLLVTTVCVAAINLVGNVWGYGPDVPIVGTNAVVAGMNVVLVGIVWWFVRGEGISFSDLGVGVVLVGPAVAAVTGFYVLLNAVGIGLAVATAGPTAVGYQWTAPLGTVAVEFVYMLIVAGLVEELAFRGYLQSKVIALLPEDARARSAIGVLTASVLFAAAHIPRVLVDGVPGSQALASYVAFLLVSGLGFGTLYELTQNLYVPILVHATGNLPGTVGIVFFDVGALPAWATLLYLGVYLVLFGVVIAGYRRSGADTEWFPVWTTRRDTVRRF